MIFPSQINLPCPHYPYYPPDNASNNWNKCVIEIYAAERIFSENILELQHCRKQPQAKAQVLYELRVVLIALGDGSLI